LEGQSRREKNIFVSAKQSEGTFWMSLLFPYSDEITFGSQSLSSSQVLEILGEFLTSERQARITRAVAGRTYSVVPVLENIYDRGNASAVMRSAEAMGFQSVHLIETGEKFKKANRVTQGADKWLDVVRWKSTGECIGALKSKGYKIYATHLDERARPIDELDFRGPVAWVLGNEKDGISEEMIQSADQTVIIPMQGFVQSFNISVAGAISFYHILRERVRLLGQSGDLTEAQKLRLRAEFSLRSSDNPEALIEKVRAR
jgi:tRNA (guanosine-2'-O-)-methyltransferase